MNALFITVVHIIAFFAIGLLAALALERRRVINKYWIVIGAYAVSCLISYGLFYIYALSPAVGTYCTEVFYVTGLLSAGYLAYRLGRNAALRKVFMTAVLPVLLIILVVASLYSALTFSCRYRKVPTAQPFVYYNACVLYNAPGDNALAQFFGQKLLDNHDYDLSGDWHLADRPPLEIGAVISLLDVLPKDNAQLAAYEFFSIILQLSWVAGLWALLNAMRVRRQAQYFVIFISSLTGFYYYNSIYAWPKFLAAGFAVAALGLLVYPPPGARTAPPRSWVVAAVLLALSMLAHGSSLFILIPLALYLIVSRRLPGLRVLVLFLAVSFSLYGPWIIYQQHTTPDDRLVKWHLAGVTAASDRGSAPRAIIDSYKNISFDRWLHNRADNVGQLFGSNIYEGGKNPYLVHVAKDPGERSLLDRIRKQEFFSLFPALGLLNVGWIILLRNKLRHETAGPLVPLLFIAGTGLVAWVALMFTAGSTVNHQNSYAVILLLFTSLALGIATAGAVFRKVIFGLQLAVFYLVWVYGLYKINGRLGELIPITAVLILYAAIAYYYAVRATRKMLR